MESKFTISEVFHTSWKSVKSQIWVLVGLLIGFCILSMIITLFTTPAQKSVSGQIIASLINLIISSLFTMGYYKNIFQTLDGEEPQFSAYGQQSRKILTYIVASFLFFIAISIGCILFIIPGIYLAIRLQFFIAFIVEEDCGILDSLKRSWEITDKQAMPLFLLGLAMFGIMLLGFILLIVGIFVTIPVVYTMYCYTFRKLNTIKLETPEEI